MLFKEFLTIEQVANRRQTSKAAVYKTLKKLKEKGAISGSQRGGLKNRRVCLRGGLKNSIRLHGIAYKYTFLPSASYNRILSQRNIIRIDKNTIKLYPNSMLIYLSQSFLGKDTQDADIQLEQYRQQLNTQLEDNLNIKITQEHRFAAHYSETNNGLAKDANENKKPIKIKGEDGKTWLITDNSFKLEELETIHPELAKDDMDKIKPFFDDIRQNPIRLSEILSVIKLIAEQNKETATGLNAVVTLIKGSEPKEDKNARNKTIPDYIN